MIALVIFLIAVMATWRLVAYSSRKGAVAYSMGRAVHLAESKIEQLKGGVQGAGDSGNETCDLSDDCLLSWRVEGVQIGGVNYKRVEVAIRWQGHEVVLLNFVR